MAVSNSDLELMTCISKMISDLRNGSIRVERYCGAEHIIAYKIGTMIRIDVKQR